MLCALVCAGALACSTDPPTDPARTGAAPLRVFLRGGPKTHGEGEHDHPRFVAEWGPLLAERGAIVESALEFPTREQLERTDVLVLYAAEGGSIHGAERADLEVYLARGGGIVVLHDALCGDDPLWFKTVVGGAWEHGSARWHEGRIGLYLADRDHAITRGAENFDLEDEIYTDLHLEPGIHVLARAFPDVFEAPPQMWTYERDGHRAFVSLQGHEYASFAHPAWRTLLLRGIAWAGRRDAERLTDAKERAALAYPPGGPTRPEEAADKIVPEPDLELSLVAAEPLIEKPISLDWDPQGRLWVACTPGYPEKAEFSGVAARDRIDVLEDADGDGRMDRAQTFADGLDLVTSFVFHERGAIASAAPDILSLQDTDGDGRADVRTVLYTGFGYADTHAVVSNLRWGLDGWIYATQGYSGSDSKDVRSGERRFGKIGNGVFRFRPDGSAIEMVSSYASNTWGLDFDAEGELFFSMANGAHIRHVVLPERALAGGRLSGVETWRDIADHERVCPIHSDEREPYLQIDFVGGFTAASGCLIYTGGAWPEEFQGNHIVAEPTVHLVHRDVLAPNGVSFSASKPREQEFLASTDPWFLPVHQRVGPDGAVYVLDMYGQAIVHNDTRGPQHGPTNAAQRPDRDHTHGRIWRVQHRAARELPAVRVDARSPPGELARALEHENGWVRETAHRLLSERGTSRPLLAAMAADPSKPVPARVRALWVLAQSGELDAADLAKALSQRPVSGLNRQATRIAGELGVADELRAELLACLDTSDPRLALEAVVALGSGGLDERVLAGLAGCFAKAKEEWTRSAVVSAAAREPVEALRAALAADGETSLLVEELAAIIGRAGRTEDVAAAIEAIEESKGRAELAARALRRLDRAWKPGGALPLSDSTAQALSRALEQEDLELASAGLALAVRFEAGGPLSDRIEALAQRVSEHALDPDAPASERLVAARALLAVPGHVGRGVAAAEALLDPLHAPQVQLDAIDELGRVEDERATAALVGAYPRLGNAGRERAFQKLFERAPRVRALVDALASGAVAPNDLGPHKLAQLRNYSDPAVAAAAEAALAALSRIPSKDVESLIADLLPIVEQPGDAERGREVFAVNCFPCHAVRGEGGNVGPKLDGVGTHGAASLLPMLLDPSRTVEAAYVEYVAETTDGRMAGGVLVRETPGSVVLRSSAGEVEIARDELAWLRSTGRSPMPTGFETLGGEALRDLVAYLGAGYEGYRTIDLRALCNASTQDGLYDVQRDPNPLRFTRQGVIDVGGVPFEVLDPALAPSGANAIVLKGGVFAQWQCKRDRPRRVEVPIGLELARLHVLGGIAGFGHPYVRDVKPIVRWVWRFGDGSEEAVELHNGVEFADWIRRHDVPGSEWVPDLVQDGSAGQVRVFSLAPSRTARVESLVLESYDNELAPTFLALTAELAGMEHGASPAREGSATAAADVDVLLVGGGSSHDFARWFGGCDLELLREASASACAYTEDLGLLASQLERARALVLSTNQVLPTDAQRAIESFVARGGGLLAVHPACWVNWTDWPEYNGRILGGGARSHEDYAELEVRITDGEHPIARGVERVFRITDELYRFERAAAGPDLHVIAVGRSLATGAEYPVAWTVAREKGRTACLTLGHDGAAHEHPAFRALLTNAARWVAED